MDRMNSKTAPLQPTPCAICGKPTPYYAPGRSPIHPECSGTEWPAAPLRSAEADVLAEEVKRLRGEIARYLPIARAALALRAARQDIHAQERHAWGALFTTLDALPADDPARKEP